MNFNLIATLIAVCASFTAAFGSDKKEKLVSAPPVRGGKHGKHGSKHGSKHDLKHAEKASKHDKPVKLVQVSAPRPSSSSSKSIASRPARSSLQVASDAHKASQVCARKLEEVLYGPSSNVKTYLQKIATEMRTDIKVIMAAFAGGNLDYLRSYVLKYHILITISGPFGQPVLVAPDFNAYTDYFKNVGFARTLVGIDGFYADPANQYYNYQFALKSAQDQYITFVLSLPFVEMTLTPTNDC